MTDWITPKTNWTYGDYFQVSDADRISNNLQYLKELSTPLYPPDDPIYYLPYRDTYGTKYFYCLYDIHPKNMVIVNAQATSSVTVYFSKTLETIFKFTLLYRAYHDYEQYPDLFPVYPIEYIDPSYTKYYVNYYYSNDPTQFYEGYGQVSSMPAYPSDPLKPIWNNFMYLYGTCPFVSGVYGAGSGGNVNLRAYIDADWPYALGNLMFYDSTMLNRIERSIGDLYTFFNELAEEFPKSS